MTPNVSDGGSCRTPDLDLNQSNTPDCLERPDRLEISPIPPLIPKTIPSKETVEMDFGPSSGPDRPPESARVVCAEPSKEPDQTSLVKTPVNSICDFSVGEETAEKEPNRVEIIQMSDDVTENEDNEPVIIKMTDDVIESEDGSDDVIDDIITIPVEDMGVKSEIFDLRMGQNQMTPNQMTHNSMTHNQMNHNQMNHNQMLQSLRQNIQLSVNNDSKRKFNGAQFQNQNRSVRPSDWSKPDTSSLQFKPINTPESRLSSSSFSSGLPSSIDFDQPGSPPASLDGFTTYVINQENYHRNDLILGQVWSFGLLNGRTLVKF